MLVLPFSAPEGVGDLNDPVFFETFQGPSVRSVWSWSHSGIFLVVVESNLLSSLF